MPIKSPLDMTPEDFAAQKLRLEKLTKERQELLSRIRYDLKGQPRPKPLPPPTLRPAPQVPSRRKTKHDEWIDAGNARLVGQLAAMVFGTLVFLLTKKTPVPHVQDLLADIPDHDLILSDPCENYSLCNVIKGRDDIQLELTSGWFKTTGPALRIKFPPTKTGYHDHITLEWQLPPTNRRYLTILAVAAYPDSPYLEYCSHYLTTYAPYHHFFSGFCYYPHAPYRQFHWFVDQGTSPGERSGMFDPLPTTLYPFTWTIDQIFHAYTNAQSFEDRLTPTYVPVQFKPGFSPLPSSFRWVVKNLAHPFNVFAFLDHLVVFTHGEDLRQNDMIPQPDWQWYEKAAMETDRAQSWPGKYTALSHQDFNTHDMSHWL